MCNKKQINRTETDSIDTEKKLIVARGKGKWVKKVKENKRYKPPIIKK